MHLGAEIKKHRGLSRVCEKLRASETRRPEIRAKAAELRARLAAILCNDLARKKTFWDSFEPPSKILNDPSSRRHSARP